MSFFNAPIKVPNGSAVKLENTSSNVVSLYASQTAFSAGNYSFYLPGNVGTPNQVLTTDGSGITSWTTVSGGGGSSNVSASNITLGASAVLLSTFSGNVRINAGAGDPVLIQVADTSVASFSTSNITADKKIIITNTDDSTSNVTGALQVAGGAGITSNLFVGGNLTVALASNLYGNVRVSGVTNLVNATESTSITSGALTVTGGVGITSNLNVGNKLAVTGTLDVDNTVNFNGITESTSSTSGTLIVDGGVGVAKSLYVGANLSVGARLLYAVDNFTTESLTSPLAQPLWAGTTTATIKHIQPPTNVTHYFHSNTSSSYTTGQNMHIFFTRPGSNSACAANVDFGTSNLYTGTGTAQYLVLTQPGQSASLIYLGGADSVKGWRIINTGGQVY